MKLGELIDQLSRIADHAGREADVEINGERVTECTISLQNPLARVRTNNSGMVQMRNDKTRNSVLAIAVNGREVPDLPVREFDERSW